MSQFKSENQSGYTKKSWINDLMNDKVLSANLTEEYAHDVLESVADETFSNLDAAIADLSLRTGLTASEVGIIKTAAIKMVQACDDIPGNVKEEDKPAGAEAELLKTTDEEEDKPAGAEAILQRKKKEVAASKKVIADSNLDSKSVEELEALIYNWMTVAMPGATGKDTQMLISQRVKEAEAILQRKKKEAEGSSCGCDVKTSGYQRKLEDNKRGKGQEKEKKEEGKQGGKKKELPEALKKHMFKKKIKMDKKKSCSSLTSKIREAWFQNQTEAPSAEAGGKTVESNPERMGFPSELKYDRLEVSAPGGEDSRPFEMKKYKEEATETKKVMGPKGEEFELRIDMQRGEKGDKPANARLTALRQVVAGEKKPWQGAGKGYGYISEKQWDAMTPEQQEEYQAKWQKSSQAWGDQADRGLL